MRILTTLTHQGSAGVDEWKSLCFCNFLDASAGDRFILFQELSINEQRKSALEQKYRHIKKPWADWLADFFLVMGVWKAQSETKRLVMQDDFAVWQVRGQLWLKLLCVP